MARYENVRGYLDCDFEELDTIRGIVAGYGSRAVEFQLGKDVLDLYLSGWVYQPKEINWVAHAFFGASMRPEGSAMVLDVVSTIAERLPEVEGRFFVDDEEGSVSARWCIADGVVTVTSE
ncbi:hypothetical protein [Streptomyces zhihengii]|uniref:hypothetical protein n=1 Tax=Streptomyces zhihengii TaxID=1818004 RepID=UPI0033AA4844